MNTLEDVKAKANEIELYSVDFLNAQGEISKDRLLVTQVRLVFADNTELFVPFEDFSSPEGQAIRFTLMPKRDN